MNKFYFFLLAIFFCPLAPLRAQAPILPDTNRFPFLNLEANQLILPTESPSNFLRLHEKMFALRTEKKGSLHILQLGDSHIQADYLTARVRDELVFLLDCSQAGRGLVFPYKFAGTNNPENYRFYSRNRWEAERSVNRNSSGETGLAGVSVYTADTVINFSIKLLDRTAPVVPFTHLTIYFSSVSPILSVEAGALHCESIPSANDGICTLQLQSEIPLDSARISLHLAGSGASSFHLHGLNLSNGHAGFVYSALGSNGASAESFLRSRYLLNQLALVMPDVLVISLGTNDAYYRPFDREKFRQQYDSLLHKISLQFPELPIVLSTPADAWFRDHKTNQNVNLVREDILSAAQKYSCAVWDLHELMGGTSSINKWYLAGLARKDRLHFSKEGYALAGDMLARAWADFYNTPMLNE